MFVEVSEDMDMVSGEEGGKGLSSLGGGPILSAPNNVVRSTQITMYISGIIRSPLFNLREGPTIPVPYSKGGDPRIFTIR